VLCAVGATLALAACESGAGGAATDLQSTDGALLSQSFQLFKESPSVRVTARAAVAMGTRVEIATDRRKNCLADAQNGFFQVAVERGGRTWMRWSDDVLDPARAISARQTELSKGLRGKWLQLSSDGRIRKSMVDLCALAAVHTIAEQLSQPGQQAVREAEVSENGERLAPLRQGEKGHSVTAYVTTDGKPYPRKIVVDMPTFAPEPVDFLLDAYGDPVSVKPPETSRTVRSEHLEALAEEELAAGLPSR
jgi:hypothetical protein